MIRTGVFLQVRMASQRLYGKALLELAGKPVVWHAMEALRAVPADVYALVTDEESVPMLSDVAEERGFDLFAGDPEDVLERYCEAARYYGVDEIVRSTGDNPLVSASVARDAIAFRRETNADYAGITETPLGTGVEILNAYALLDLASWTDDRYDREHVSPGLYRNPDRYIVRTRAADAALRYPTIRVTLDTADDYSYLSYIYRNVYRGAPIEIPEIVLFAQEHQESSA
jgi:spore coat polysaccharide biosynthesis protein SpsF